MKWTLTIVFCAFLATSAFASNILTNPGFESGSLAPWFNSNDFCSGCTWSVTNSDSHTGSYSAIVSGNRLLEQDFSAVADSSISDISLWLKMPGTGIAAVFFRYSDASTDENVVSVGSSWSNFDMTSFLNPSKSLVGFGVYGCSGCPGNSTTLADDFLVEAATAVPEPGSIILLGTGLLGLAGVARRKLSL